MQTNIENTAMEILKQIQAIPENQDPSERLEKFMHILAAGFNADAAVCYVTVDDNYLEFLCGSGLVEKQYKHHIRYGEGFIGEIAATRQTLSYSYSAEQADGKKNERPFKSALGAPLLRWSRTYGTVIIAHKQEYSYSQADIEALETVAMFLTATLSSEEMIAYKKKFIKSRGLRLKDHLKGIVLNKGYGIGSAVVHRRRQAVTEIFAEDINKELARLEDAKEKMNKSLDEKFNAAQLGIGEHTDILETYRMFARDKGWYRKISDNIAGGLTADAAVERAYEDMWNRLSGSSDIYLKERLHDLRDVADRLRMFLSGNEKKLNQINNEQDIIIVAQTMGPADLMDYDYKKIRGLILEEGTPTMHVAIVAKALNIPVVAKINGIFKDVKDGELLGINGEEGFVYINPSDDIVQKFKSKQKNMTLLLEQLKQLRRFSSKTLDGIRISLNINVGLDFDFDYIDSTKCDGIGLYRTEIPFMSSETMPDVAQQVNFYQKLMSKAGNKKVIFRSLDVGSDKLLPYWGDMKENNPAIGWRSIRITLDRRAILRQQLKSFLKVTAGKELNIMFPMISSLEEFLDAKETLMIEVDKERKKGEAMPSKINVGLMIEVPSVVFQLDDVLKYADFISIGTNDLAQFMFACDRGNPRITDRYDVLSAPFLRALKQIIDKADAAGVPCSVCGEMAGTPIEAMVLIGLGFRKLSMAGSAFGNVKKMVRTLRVQDITDYVQTLLKSPKRTLRPQLSAYAHDHGIAI
ncbi:MAG: phosphoenolpyruvate--protein phosphotransferase [Alphaproteobacteria bacterium]|nr:phosphoenolpyruvate--protein phosphotransferase [Alphaproteobacteria bacterium]